MAVRKFHDDDGYDDEDPFEEAGTDDGEDTVPCPFCQRPIYEDAERCPYCENYVWEVDADHGGGHKPWWVVLGVLVCLLLVLWWIVSGW